MVGNLEFKWHDMDDQILHIVVASADEGEGDYINIIYIIIKREFCRVVINYYCVNALLYKCMIILSSDHVVGAGTVDAQDPDHAVGLEAVIEIEDALTVVAEAAHVPIVRALEESLVPEASPPIDKKTVVPSQGM